jgi:hypothetical protein
MRVAYFVSGLFCNYLLAPAVMLMLTLMSLVGPGFGQHGW